MSDMFCAHLRHKSWIYDGVSAHLPMMRQGMVKNTPVEFSLGKNATLTHGNKCANVVMVE